MTEFRTWDQLTELEQLQSTYSDAFKDANGFRPRFMSDEQWNSVEWLRAEIDECCKAIEADLAYEAEMEKLHIARFESMVAKQIENGAADRATAIRWLMQAEDIDDTELFCYKNALPYDYIPNDILEVA